VFNIYVGNLSFNTTEAELRAAFEAHGEVTKASIVKDRETDRPRGFAFVEMANAQDGRNAVEALNGTSLGGRNISCNEARERPARSGGGGGGYRGGGDRGGRGGDRGDRGDRGGRGGSRY
jgi:cold-inducible RNA-binding protein